MRAVQTARQPEMKRGTILFPYEQWEPLSVAEVVALFEDAPCFWALAGGYAVELFLGRSVREHGDIDVIVFRDEQRAAQTWLQDAQLFVADPPGTLRPWLPGEWLPTGRHDIWGYGRGARAWQFQLMLVEVAGDEWVYRRNPAIRGPRHSLRTCYGGVPCIPIEVQLLYKAKGYREKDRLDFDAALPLLSPSAQTWLQNALAVAHPEHPWIARLAA